MNLLKLVSIINWIFIGVIGILLLAGTLFPSKGGDPAGRGMGLAIYYLAIILLVVLVVLNLMPQNWAKYTAFGLIAIPALLFVLGPGIGRLKRNIGNMIEASKPIFPDKERDRAARAIYNNKPETLKRLLEEPIPNLNEGGELLAFAINFAKNNSENATEKLECVRLLFQAGASLDSLDRTLDVPIHFSVADIGDAALLRMLLDHGADPNAVQHYFKRAVIFDALGSNFDPEGSVRTLLDHGADPNVTAVLVDDQGPSTPLVRAAEYGRWGICIALLEKGADPAFETREGLSLLTFVERAESSFPLDSFSTREDFERLKAMLPH